MNKYVAILIVLIAGLVVLAGCTQPSSADSNGTAGVSIQNNPANNSGGNVTPPAGDNNTPAPNYTNDYPEPVVTIQNFAFSPSSLRVKVHTSVNWNNLDSMTHKIMVDNFQSQNINQGGVFKYTFDTPGTYPYYCTLHPSMTGTIIVD